MVRAAQRNAFLHSGYAHCCINLVRLCLVLYSRDQDMESENQGRRVTVRDIADQLRISHSTVSRSLRDDRRISEEVRQAVKLKAQEMGYRPDPMLSALAQYRRGIIQTPISAGLAWVNQWPQPKQLRSYREFDLYWKGAFAEAEECGFRLEEFIVNRQMTPARLEKILLARNIQGILIPPHGSFPPQWSDFNWENFCVVRF